MRGTSDVHNYLANLGVPHEICPEPVRARSARMVAQILGLRSSDTAKCVLFLVEGQPVLAIVPSNKVVSRRKLAKALGAAKVELAAADFTCQLTGYQLGATPPVALEGDIRVLVDRRLVDREIIYTAGGEIGTVLKIRPNDLVRAAEATVEDVAR